MICKKVSFYVYEGYTGVDSGDVLILSVFHVNNIFFKLSKKSMMIFSELIQYITTIALITLYVFFTLGWPFIIDLPLKRYQNIPENISTLALLLHIYQRGGVS